MKFFVCACCVVALLVENESNLNHCQFWQGRHSQRFPTLNQAWLKEDLSRRARRRPIKELAPLRVELADVKNQIRGFTAVKFGHHSVCNGKTPNSRIM